MLLNILIDKRKKTTTSVHLFDKGGWGSKAYQCTAAQLQGQEVSSWSASTGTGPRLREQVSRRRSEQAGGQLIVNTVSYVINGTISLWEGSLRGPSDNVVRMEADTGALMPAP